MLRGLIALHQHSWPLDKVKRVLKLNVYIQCTPDFTLHSEVADGASDRVVEHPRPGRCRAAPLGRLRAVAQNAAIELDFIVSTS